MKWNYLSALLAVLASCSLEEIDAGGNAPDAIDTSTPQKGPSNVPGGGANIAKNLRRGLEKSGKAKKGAKKAPKKLQKHPARRKLPRAQKGYH